MATVTISGNSYDVYASEAECVNWMTGRVGGSTWLSAASDLRKQSLVTATRWLQGLSGWVDGEAPAVADAPAAVKNACCELAYALVVDPSAQTADTGNNKKRLKAGSAEIEYFRPTEGTVVPKAAWNLLVSAGLVGGTVSGGSVAYGTCDEPTIADGYGDLSNGYA